MGVFFDSVTAELLACLVVLVVSIYWYYSRAFKFWEEKGLACVKPSFPAGNAGPLITAQLQIGHVFETLYNKLKNSGPVAGFYLFARPGLLVTDPEMIKTITVRDFKFFPDRGVYYNEKGDPLSAHLFNLEGIKWKNLRIKLSPTFTSGKMKMMFPIMLEGSVELTKYLKEQTLNCQELEIKDPLARFTTDVIGNCAFGINCNSLTNPDAEFRKYGRKFFELSNFQTLKNAFSINFKRLSAILGLKITDKKVSDFFMGAVKDTVDHREKNNISRNDFMQLLIQLKNNDGGKAGESLTMNEVAAQAFVFFLGGFETSSSTMSFATYELALNSEIQTKAREDIERILAKYGGQITYEALQEMEYLDMVIYETLRKYPVVPVLNREVLMDYTLPGTKTIIPAGMPVIIPVRGLHYDPEYYPEPERFDPERFSSENKAARHPFAFLPFGEGPRICIGMRFGMMQTRLGLITILKNYKIQLSERTPVPLEYCPKGLVTTSIGGIYLKLTALKN